MLDKDYFYFRQFKIKQSKSAFKVGFDGILLGAWADFTGANNILDIGTGTGLLALMATQKNLKANIFAIEPDVPSFKEAEENFAYSPWDQRLKIFNQSLQNFTGKNAISFDHIISNPPYFIKSKLPAKNEYISTKHTYSLSHEELALNASKLLNDSGKLSIILPNIEGELFNKTAFKYNLYLSRLTNVITKSKTERLVLELRKNTVINTIKNELIIYHKDGKYTAEYIDFVKDFYLWA